VNLTGHHPKECDPKVAPGIDDQEELEQKATQVEIKKDDFTKVTTLSYDEVNPS
jgi:hypothetical protein